MLNAWKRLPRLSGRCLYMIALVIMMMVYDFNGPLVRVPMVMLILPWGCGVAYAGIQTYKGKLGLKNWLLIACSACMIVATIKSCDLGQMTLYALGAEVVCMLGIGIVPEGTDSETLHRELLAFCWAFILFMLPVMFLSVLSVFIGHTFRLGTGIMGLVKENNIFGRIYIVHHPNIGGRRAEMCVLFAIYALHYSKKRWQRVLLWLTMALAVMAIAHCQTRSCTLTLGVIFGALLYRWVYLRLAQKKWRVPAALFSGAALAVLTVVGLELVYRLDLRIALSLVAQAEEVGASRVVTKGILDISGSGRNPIWEISFEFLKAHPKFLLIGTGATNVTNLMAQEFPQAANYSHLHNSFLELLVLGGIPMLVCMVTLLAQLVRPCYRMLIARETDGDRGAYILPIIIGSMLLMTVTEAMLFTRPTVINLIFFLAVGRVIYAQRRKTIGQPE